MVDYNTELKRLEEGGSFWKPKAGQFKLKALSEIEEKEPYIRKHENAEDEVSPQAGIKILIGEEEKTWTFGKGQTLASTYGQLIKLASESGGKLMGVEFSVVVKSDGTKNDYTIININQ